MVFTAINPVMTNNQWLSVKKLCFVGQENIGKNSIGNPAYSMFQLFFNSFLPQNLAESHPKNTHGTCDMLQLPTAKFR